MEEPNAMALSVDLRFATCSDCQRFPGSSNAKKRTRRYQEQAPRPGLSEKNDTSPPENQVLGVLTVSTIAAEADALGDDLRHDDFYPQQLNEAPIATQCSSDRAPGFSKLFFRSSNHSSRKEVACLTALLRMIDPVKPVRPACVDPIALRR
jgi:hypothetical protein